MVSPESHTYPYHSRFRSPGKHTDYGFNFWVTPLHPVAEEPLGDPVFPQADAGMQPPFAAFSIAVVQLWSAPLLREDRTLSAVPKADT